MDHHHHLLIILIHFCKNKVILLRPGKLDPSKTAFEEVGLDKNLGFHRSDHKNDDDDQVAMCTLAFLELVNEGNIQAQVVALIIIVTTMLAPKTI